MQKKEFKYRQMKYVVVWMLVLGAPFILFVPDLLSQIDGTAYYIVNTLTMIFIIFVLWRLVNILPGVQRTGYFWKENGITVIEYGSKRVILNSVTELMLTDRHASSQGINLLIRNDGRRIEFLSEPLDKGSSIDSTSLYNIFSQVLAENSRLKMENDIHRQTGFPHIFHKYKRPWIRLLLPPLNPCLIFDFSAPAPHQCTLLSPLV